jgi:hypothetical protein
VALAQGIGRFGYTTNPKIPNWFVADHGIRPLFQGAPTIEFDGTVRKRIVTGLSPDQFSANWVSTDFAPTRFKISLFSPGPELLFERGLKLRFRTVQPPILSWTEGSVGPEVPTPKLKWVVVSFQESLPPVLLAFPDSPAAVVVKGNALDWVLEWHGEPYKSWVRFALPLGVRALTTKDAAALGLMIASVKKHEDYWQGPSPKLVSVSTENERYAVTGIWKFSHAGAVVPPAAFLARRGGYDVQNQSKIVETNAPTDEGPLAFLDGTELRLRFPILFLQKGRALTAGPATWTAPLPDPKKPFSLFNSAISAMCGPRQQTLPADLRKSLEGYLGTVKFTTEPITKMQLPFDGTGVGASEAAFYCIIQQALLNSEGINMRPNPLFRSLVWARDVMSWRLDGIQDHKVRRRAGALAAVAGAMSTNPQMRLDGAMMQAGLTAERALYEWRGVTVPKILEPIELFRSRLFRGKELPQQRDPLLPYLVHPMRVLVGPPIFANNTKEGYVIRFNMPEKKAQRVALQAPVRWTIEAIENVETLDQAEPEPRRYELKVTPKKKGWVVLRITTEGAPRPLPPQVTPVYSEVYR